MTSIDRRGLLKATMATLTAGKLAKASTSVNTYDLGETWTDTRSLSSGWIGGMRGQDGVIYCFMDNEVKAIHRKDMDG